MKAAGINLNYISDKERVKLSKRNRRKYMTNNFNMQVLHREIAKSKEMGEVQIVFEDHSKVLK